MPGPGPVAAARGIVEIPADARNPPVSLVMCSMIVVALALGCDRALGPGSVHGTVTLVNRVRATMRGLNCANCGATLEALLAKRLDPASISVAPLLDRVAVDFERSATPFSSASFRRAVGEAGGEVLSLQIEACGTIETTQQGSWMTSGSTRLLLEGPGPLPAGTELCVTGNLRDDSRPVRLVLGKR